MSREYGEYSTTTVVTPSDPAMKPWPFNPIQAQPDNGAIHARVTGITPAKVNDGLDSISIECYNTTTGALVASQEFNGTDYEDDAGGILNLDFTGLTNGQSYTLKGRQFTDF